jgi:hypothetical protein
VVCLILRQLSRLRFTFTSTLKTPRRMFMFQRWHAVERFMDVISGTKEWKTTPIQTLTYPVAMAYGDFRGVGLNDSENYRSELMLCLH